jgi:hypothetical protein
VQCVPSAAVPRRRRHWFVERELLERVRQYEDLLRKNSIKFESFHADHAMTQRVSLADEEPEVEVDLPSTSPTVTARTLAIPKRVASEAK